MCDLSCENEIQETWTRPEGVGTERFAIPECLDHILRIPHQLFIIITDNPDYQGGNKGGTISDCGLVLRTPTFRAGLQFRIAGWIMKGFRWQEKESGNLKPEHCAEKSSIPEFLNSLLFI